MDVNIENVEVQDVEDAVEGAAGTDDLSVREDVLHSVESAAEEDASPDSTSEGEPETPAVDGGVRDGSEQSPGDDLGGELAVAGEPGPVTETYANDGMYVDCVNQTTTYWLETREILVYPDGTVEFTDTKPVRTETSWPSTLEELASRDCEITQEEVPVTETAEPVVETTPPAPSVHTEQPVMLAETGVEGVGVPITLGALALVVVGAWLIANQVAKNVGRKNK